MEDLDTFSSLLPNCPQLIFHTVSANGSDACMCLVQNRVKRLKSAISYSPPFYSVLLVEQLQNMI